MNKKSELSSVRVVAGLGNPGDEYTHTYHNVGMLALEYISKHLPDSWSCSQLRSPYKSFSYYTVTGPDKQTVVFVFPHTYMNESGLAVSRALQYFKLPLSSLLVLHDDSDMTIGSCKITFDQRSAGHRGIESIMQQCGGKNFYRGKIGIRPAQEVVRKKADEFVLKNISKKDFTVFEKEIFPYIISDIFTPLLKRLVVK